MALIHIFFTFLLLSLQPSTSVEICGVPCGDDWIHFPFSLDIQPNRCGYPGFHLSCQNQNQTTITLPFNGEFRVKSIDYWSQSIWINDPDDCTPKRLLKGLNLSHTPFEPLNSQDYIILNCSLPGFKQPSGLMYISCLSGQTFSVVAIPVDLLNFYAPSIVSCRTIATVALPDSAFNNYGVMLTWNQPDCKSCEQNAGACMFKSDTGLDVGCSGGFRSGLTKSAKYGLIFGLGVPLLCIFVLVYYLRSKVNDYSHRQHPTTEISIEVALGAQRRLAAEHKGLDVSTIEGYPTTLVSESRELPRPSDNTCSICLCEYEAKETLRTIPDCKHYFHVSCIDEWLKLNATCPVCRNDTTDQPSVQNIASSSSPSSSR